MTDKLTKEDALKELKYHLVDLKKALDGVVVIAEEENEPYMIFTLASDISKVANDLRNMLRDRFPQHFAA